MPVKHILGPCLTETTLRKNPKAIEPMQGLLAGLDQNFDPPPPGAQISFALWDEKWQKHKEKGGLSSGQVGR
jgi:hypothetical protein